jgi:hypothetical protein
MACAIRYVTRDTMKSCACCLGHHACLCNTLRRLTCMRFTCADGYGSGTMVNVGNGQGSGTNVVVGDGHVSGADIAGDNGELSGTDLTAGHGEGSGIDVSVANGTGEMTPSSHLHPHLVQYTIFCTVKNLCPVFHHAFPACLHSWPRAAAHSLMRFS